MKKMREKYFHSVNQQTASSLGVILPKAYAKNAGLESTDSMEITINSDGSLTMRPVKLPEDFTFENAAN